MDKLLLAKILKELSETGDIQRANYNLELEGFGQYLETALSEGLVENINVQRAGQGNRVVLAFTKGGRVTFKGQDFIKENIEQ